jgi:hypothetical protein
MVVEDFLLDPQVRTWLDGVEPAWMLLAFDSLRALQREPSAAHHAIRIANTLSVDEIADSAVARNTLILLRQAIEDSGLALTATGNLSRAVVADMRKLMEWPNYDQADAFRLHRVINEPDFLPLHVVRQLAEAATLVRPQGGKLLATALGKSMLSQARQGSLLAILFHLAFWHTDLGYFCRGLLGSWPQADAGVALWSLSVCANEWQPAEKLARLCTFRSRLCFLALGIERVMQWRPKYFDPCSGLACLSTVARRSPPTALTTIISIVRLGCSIEC